MIVLDSLAVMIFMWLWQSGHINHHIFLTGVALIAVNVIACVHYSKIKNSPKTKQLGNLFDVYKTSLNAIHKDDLPCVHLPLQSDVFVFDKNGICYQDFCPTWEDILEINAVCDDAKYIHVYFSAKIFGETVISQSKLSPLSVDIFVAWLSHYKKIATGRAFLRILWFL